MRAQAPAFDVPVWSGPRLRGSAKSEAFHRSRRSNELYTKLEPGCNSPRGAPVNCEQMVSVDEVTEALRDVIDPELGLDFVELGLIYEIQVEGGTVKVTYSLTTPACPIGPHVSEQIEEFVGELEGVEQVEPTMTFSPPWTPERMSEDAKFALGF